MIGGDDFVYDEASGERVGPDARAGRPGIFLREAIGGISS